MLEYDKEKLLNIRGRRRCGVHKYEQAIEDFKEALNNIHTKESKGIICNNKGLALYYRARDYYLTKPKHEKDDDLTLYKQERKGLYNQALRCFNESIGYGPYLRLPTNLYLCHI